MTLPTCHLEYPEHTGEPESGRVGHSHSSVSTDLQTVPRWPLWSANYREPDVRLTWAARMLSPANMSVMLVVVAVGMAIQSAWAVVAGMVLDLLVVTALRVWSLPKRYLAHLRERERLRAMQDIRRRVVVNLPEEHRDELAHLESRVQSLKSGPESLSPQEIEVLDRLLAMYVALATSDRRRREALSGSHREPLIREIEELRGKVAEASSNGLRGIYKRRLAIATRRLDVLDQHARSMEVTAQVLSSIASLVRLVYERCHVGVADADCVDLATLVEALEVAEQARDELDRIAATT